MSAAAQHYERYPTSRGCEWLLRIGAADAPPILIVPPLFEELNRTRALIVAVMRRLADAGHGCWLPDLAGTGESAAGLEQVGWDDWRGDIAAAATHVRAAAGRAPISAAVRGGCLLDDAAEGRDRWRFAPVTGASLARDLDRASLGGGAEWVGYHQASSALRAGLAEAVPAPVPGLRTVRLATDAAEADAKVAGPALWRRSEPGMSPELAAALAGDLADWSRACAAS